MPIGPQKASKANSNHRLLFKTDLTPAGDGTLQYVTMKYLLPSPSSNFFKLKLVPGIVIARKGTCSKMVEATQMETVRLNRDSQR